MKRILIVTGQSGSGKSSALQVLEDLGYYCIDNLPLALLTEIVLKLDRENNLEQQLRLHTEYCRTVQYLDNQLGFLLYYSYAQARWTKLIL